jgi:hypothetical protein
MKNRAKGKIEIDALEERARQNAMDTRAWTGETKQVISDSKNAIRRLDRHQPSNEVKSPVLPGAKEE